MPANKSKFGLPLKVEFCSKCVMSNQKPNSSIEFKTNNKSIKEGIYINNKICDACKYNVWARAYSTFNE